VAITLCVPPRAGELCAPIRFLLRHDSTVLELTSRHRITEVDWDAGERAVAVVVEITDPATSRPVDVRFDVLAADDETAHDETGPPRSRYLGSVSRGGEDVRVYGTYLGVVADEN
jgi:hypothetical protein